MMRTGRTIVKIVCTKSTRRPAPITEKMKQKIFFFSLLFAGAASCTVHQAVKKYEPTSFLTHSEKLSEPKNTPFNLAWIADDIESWQFDTLLVEAVKTNQQNPDDWIYSASAFIPTKESYLEKVEELAIYLQKAVSKQFDRYSGKPNPVTVERGIPYVTTPPEPEVPVEDEMKEEAPSELEKAPENALDALLPERRTLVVELSIAEVNFGDPTVYGGLLFVPVPGIANLSTAVKSPSLTIEARLMDQKTNSVITEILDRRFPQLKPIDLNRLTISSALHEMCDAFADDLVRSFYRKKGQRVRGQLAFSLLPW